jgi:hypothetical protein
MVLVYREAVGTHQRSATKLWPFTKDISIYQRRVFLKAEG